MGMLNYRPEIDGLRAFAVVPVVLFHAGIVGFEGGFVGVDIFFVISGYLITSILLTDIDTDNFSLISFYERRIRRILPALSFYFLLSSLLVFVYFPPHAVKDFSQSLVAANFFVANIFFYIETDYFNNLSELAPLLHTWSLSVEEQFYVFFPLILWALTYLSRNASITILFLLTAGSLAWSEILLQTDANLAFYGPASRFWEISSGGVLAYLLHYRDRTLNRRFESVLGFIGLFFITISIFTYSSQTRFPGLGALLPVVGTLLLIAFSNSDNFVGRMLANRALTSVGLISYSLYLSHNIIFAISRNIGYDLDHIFMKLLAIIASVILALFTFRYVEQPFRKHTLRRCCIFGFALASMVFFGVLGFYGHVSDGIRDFKFNLLPAQHRSSVIDPDQELKSRRAVWQDYLRSSGVDFVKDTEASRVLILGDSKSEDLYVASQFVDLGDGIEIRRLRLDDVCMREDIRQSIGICADELNDVLVSEVYSMSDVVILSATWQYASNRDVVRFIEMLIDEGKKVAVVSTANFNDLASLSYVIARENMTVEDRNTYLFDNIRQDWRRQYLSLKSDISERDVDVDFVEKLDAFCDFSIEQCSLQSDDNWLIYDTGHVTIEGAQRLGVFFKTYLNSLSH